jgi:cell fate regulator YaaT (PSP1 superfamily)
MIPSHTTKKLLIALKPTSLLCMRYVIVCLRYPGSPIRLYFKVHFKRTTDMFLGKTDSPYQVGTFVKVEADRGEDLGVISRVFSPTSRHTYPFDNLPRFSIICTASIEDKLVVIEKAAAEEHALNVCREYAARRRMSINVLDAEYQFDRRKLTFIFICDR